MTRSKIQDPFRVSRQASGVLTLDADGEAIPLILNYKDVRGAAKDWETFSSDAPYRIPVPSEEAVRSVRQLPIETDPPAHKAYRRLVEPHFRKPLQPDYLIRLNTLINEMVDQALGKDTFDVVHEFALPLQSKALTLLLGVPMTEAETWINWGTSVFSEGDGVAKGNQLEAYIFKQLNKAKANPGGTDFFTALTIAEIDGRSLSLEEMAGLANLAFAGGRDTVINAVSVIIAYFAEHTAQMKGIAADPRRLNLATEEFVRVISPLTFIARVCPRGADLGEAKIAPDGRVGLCWASANYDESIFQDPEEIILERSPNPHVGFGSGHHTCLGAPQARAIMRGLIECLATRVASIEIVAETPKYEANQQYKRWMAYERLETRWAAT